jgi:hypothetical protein
MLTPILEVEGELVPYLVIDLSRKTDAARKSDLLQPGRDIHPVPENVPVILDHDVAEVDPDTQLKPLGIGSRTGGNRLLKIDGAAHGVDGTCELDQESIPDRLHEAPMMRMDSRLYDLTSEIPQPSEGTLLILGHEIGIAHHVCGKHRCETSLRRVVRRAAHGLSGTSTLKRLGTQLQEGLVRKGTSFPSTFMINPDGSSGCLETAHKAAESKGFSASCR